MKARCLDLEKVFETAKLLNARVLVVGDKFHVIAKTVESAKKTIDALEVVGQETTLYLQGQGFSKNEKDGTEEAETWQCAVRAPLSAPLQAELDAHAKERAKLLQQVEDLRNEVAQYHRELNAPWYRRIF